MIYMKHPELGNAHVAAAEQAQREAQGWVKWPRTKEQKLNAVVGGFRRDAEGDPLPDSIQFYAAAPVAPRKKPGPKPKA